MFVGVLGIEPGDCGDLLLAPRAIRTPSNHDARADDSEGGGRGQNYNCQRRLCGALVVGVGMREEIERWAVVEGLPVNEGSKEEDLNVKTRLEWRAWNAGVQAVMNTR